MATSTIRHPAVAGQFYPRDIAALRKELASYLLPDVHPTHAFGCIVPHAGYMYSGHVAGAVYSQIEIPRNCVLLCPNHTGVGRALSMVADGVWETPLGSVPVYAELASALRDECPLLYDDPGAHRSEHAIEVQLPFLQIRRSDFRFVPIAVGTSQLDDLRALGHALGEVLAARGEPTLILASSDMPTANAGAPPVRLKSVCSPTICASDCISAADTEKPQFEIVAAAASGAAPTIPAGLLIAKYTPGCKTQAAIIAIIATIDSASIAPYPTIRVSVSRAISFGVVPLAISE